MSVLALRFLVREHQLANEFLATKRRARARARALPLAAIRAELHAWRIEAERKAGRRA